MWRHKGGEAGMEEALRRLKGVLGKGRGWSRGMVRALEERRFAGEAGGGMVTLQMNGLGRLMDFKIDPALGRHHVGAIEDLTITAWNDAMMQVERATIEESQKALFKVLEEDANHDIDVEPHGQAPSAHDDDDDDGRSTPR